MLLNSYQKVANKNQTCRRSIKKSSFNKMFMHNLSKLKAGNLLDGKIKIIFGDSVKKIID